ncbi:hypothetical protein GOODEAATRI_013862, partial [Goodea atripinnis]
MPNTSARPKHGRRARRRRRVDPARDQLVSSSLESAQQCLLNQDYGTAFVHYLLVLNLAPVFKDFAQVMAWLKPDYPEARENFYRVANWLVERWHFLMLNDHGRNRKYQQAIQKAVQNGCNTVLDIGTGTGILGLCAAAVGGLSMAAAGELRSPVSCSSEQDDSTEPYTTERLSRLPGGYRELTEPFTALTIDFNNVLELEGLSSREVREIRLPVTLEGELDALAVWFQLHLDEENSLSTGPQEDTCWEQAIYPVHSAMSVVQTRLNRMSLFC